MERKRSVKAHTKKWATIAVERDVLEPLQHLAATEGVHSYQLMRRLIRDEAERRGETGLVVPTEADVPKMLATLMVVVGSLVQQQRQSAEQVAAMAGDVRNLDEQSFKAVAKVHKDIVSLTVMLGLTIDALDHLDPGVSKLIYEQGKVGAAEEWKQLNDGMYGGRGPD